LSTHDLDHRACSIAGIDGVNHPAMGPSWEYQPEQENFATLAGYDTQDYQSYGEVGGI